MDGRAKTARKVDHSNTSSQKLWRPLIDTEALRFFSIKIWPGEIGVLACLPKFNYNPKIDFFLKDLA